MQSLGTRLVISALMTNSGFHVPSIDIFECDEDHSMNSNHFVRWIDRTSSLLRKQLIIEWLKRHNVSVPVKSTKAELLELACDNLSKKRYVVDETAAKYDIEILR